MFPRPDRQSTGSTGGLRDSEGQLMGSLEPKNLPSGHSAGSPIVAFPLRLNGLRVGAGIGRPAPCPSDPDFPAH